MTTPDPPKQAACPTCTQPMRRERDGVRLPPLPNLFWFCTNVDCEDGKKNRVYSGG